MSEACPESCVHAVGVNANEIAYNVHELDANAMKRSLDGRCTYHRPIDVNAPEVFRRRRKRSHTRLLRLLMFIRMTL